MRSFRVVAGQTGFASQFDNLRHDARGGSFLLAHQQLGAFALPTTPTNGQTITFTVNGTAITLTAVTGTPTNPGDVKAPGTAAAFAANVLALLNQPQTTTANGIALSAIDQQLLSYVSFSLVGTTITLSSANNSIFAPLSSLTASTTVTGASWTAQTMQLYVEPGVVYVNATRVIFSGGSTPTVTAPSGNPRIDVLSMDGSGTLAWTTGTESATPSAPTYPSDKVALCELYNVVGETALYDFENQQSGQGYIYNDVRPFLGERMNWGAFPLNLIPDTDNTRNLGSASFRFASIYGAEFFGDASNMTGINSTFTSDLFTAGMNGSAGDALIVLPISSVQVTLDTNSAFSGVGSPTITRSLSVGANSNRALVIAISASGLSSGHGISGVTYGGVSMTRITTASTGSFGTSGIWYLKAPATGSNNIVITLSTSDASTVYFNAYSYYNCAQTNTPEANAVSSSGNGESISLTTLTNGSLLFGLGSGSASIGGAITADILTNTEAASGDSGAVAPMASETVTTGSNNGAAHAISIAPFSSSPTARVYKASTALAATCASFIGFAQSSYTAAGSVRVIYNGEANVLSGLSIGSQYYLQDTPGAIGTSPGTTTRKAGIALSATDLLITNTW
jgi:hypothetical protein